MKYYILMLQAINYDWDILYITEDHFPKQIGTDWFPSFLAFAAEKQLAEIWTSFMDILYGVDWRSETTSENTSIVYLNVNLTPQKPLVQPSLVEASFV